MGLRQDYSERQQWIINKWYISNARHVQNDPWEIYAVIFHEKTKKKTTHKHKENETTIIITTPISQGIRSYIWNHTYGINEGEIEQKCSQKQQNYISCKTECFTYISIECEKCMVFLWFQTELLLLITWFILYDWY